MENEETIKKVMKYIDENIDGSITAEELAGVAQYSFYHFCHLFSAFTGCSVAAYLRRRRMELAALDLLEGSSVTSVSVKRGFETPSGFAKAFRRHYGMSPTEYKRKGGHKMELKTQQMEAFTAVGYCLAPPQGEFDWIDATAYWLGKDFSSVSKEDYEKFF